ncbi:MAG TPA: hypothetical protein PLU37_06060 [Chitinophagaceae bacterium]|nr:hypothetical protein [Chitinophagaceae bacterium]MCB9056659.1 hypothetical protein [Chitinophagales bacterium]HPG11072.1 hypothetical protein [Chitinophagaceae bacterium]HRX94693.1 hypothetical protein [Chitinophagaceae bacterium]
MHIEFIKAIQFSLLIKTDGRLREYNFRKLKTQGTELFTVNVCTERDNRIFFQVEKADDEWSLIGKDLPKWITENADAIFSATEDELKNWKKTA